MLAVVRHLSKPFIGNLGEAKAGTYWSLATPSKTKASIADTPTDEL